MSIFKIAEEIALRYKIAEEDNQDADHYGVDPETGIGIKPEFENGDLVSYRGRQAIYISKMYWDSPEQLPKSEWKDENVPEWKKPTYAMVQFLDLSPIKRDKYYNKSFNFDYVDERYLKLIMKKDERLLKNK